MIVIENHTGKIKDRFSSQNWFAFIRSKSNIDFHFQIDPQLNN